MRLDVLNKINKSLQEDLQQQVNFNYLNMVGNNLLLHTLLTFIISFVIFILVLKLTVKNITKLKLVLYSLILSIVFTIPVYFFMK